LKKVMVMVMVLVMVIWKGVASAWHAAASPCPLWMVKETVI
jgi:hypothetical protein